MLDREAVDALVAEADVLVHLAFIIFGGHEETRAINLEGSRNVFARPPRRGVKRLVYTSSVAAYGFHADNPQPLTEEVPPRGSEGYYYSAQKAELERRAGRGVRLDELEAYVFRPCIVAGPDALMLVRQIPLDPGPLPTVLPDPGTPFQLVHHDDVASALVAATTRRRRTWRLQPRGRGDDHVSATSSARSAGHAFPVPGRRRARRARRRPAARPVARAVGQRRPRADGHGYLEGPPRAALAARATDRARLCASWWRRRGQAGCAARCRPRRRSAR